MTEATTHLLDRPIGEIAAHLPGAPAVLRHLGLEICCQGHVPLSEAVTRRNLDLGAVTAALTALDPAAAPEIPQETGALIDHIRSRYHDRHRRQIPDLIALSRRVEAAHVTHPKVPSGLAETLRQFLAELDALMTRQERVDFPAMRSPASDRSALSIRVMRHEHNAFASFLDQIDRLTDDGTLPDDACATWQGLMAGLAAFRADLIDHIHLENNVLFPRFETSRQD
ncbi:MAG: iron-sulfur cluster repair di-iron protein [Rhodobacteraceae bacterium]|nr:MAG: iron-sulfur cluster repair di-iron protein [Paracoccaceae bacterium]